MYLIQKLQSFSESIRVSDYGLAHRGVMRLLLFPSDQLPVLHFYNFINSPQHPIKLIILVVAVLKSL